MAASKAEKLLAEAMFRVVARNMAAARSVDYQQLLAETAAEVDVLLVERRERDARLARSAHKQIREAQVQHAAVARARAAGSGDVEQEFRSLDLAPVPPWHPEHPLHPENDF